MATILLIDDDEAFRLVLKTVLTRSDHEVPDVRTGMEAMTICEQRIPDLVITDLVMPEREGLETIIALRQLAPDVPIIAISGAGGSDAGIYLKIARRLGARRTLAKPFGPEAILQAIDDVLAPV